MAGETALALGRLLDRLDLATFNAVHAVAERFGEEISIQAPRGTPGNSTNAPGDLAASVRVDGPSKIPGGYSAKAGPTTVYARQRELGGDIYPVNAPMLHFFWPRAVSPFNPLGEVFSLHVHQNPDPYTKTAYIRVLPNVNDIVAENLTLAMGA